MIPPKLVVFACLAALGAGAIDGCKRKPPEPADEPASAAPKANELPPLSLRDDTAKLLLTWIDEKGDFHVVMKPSDVPESHRSQVRVVVTDRTDGTGSLVYVADLSKHEADGSYPVKTMTRNAWDELGASLRKARLEALAPPPASAASASAAASAPAAPERRTGASKVIAIIYGAEWCRPCHDAARYLKQRGVTVIEKDIESSEAVSAELKKKLDRANMSGASIPIIDVMGQLLVGYSPRALDRAIATAESAKPL